MNWRNLMFYGGFALAPLLVWFLRMDPLLKRHSQALSTQVELQMAEAAARKHIYERDQLAEEWSLFRPVAEVELQHIDRQLNPIVLQNSVIDLARRLDCELRIEDRTDREADEPGTFHFSGTGRPLQVIDLLRHIERGEHRGRLTDLTVAYDLVDAETGYEAYFNGTFTIPRVPEWAALGKVEEEDAEAAEDDEEVDELDPGAGA